MKAEPEGSLLSQTWPVLLTLSTRRISEDQKIAFGLCKSIGYMQLNCILVSLGFPGPVAMYFCSWRPDISIFTMIFIDLVIEKLYPRHGHFDKTGQETPPIRVFQETLGDTKSSTGEQVMRSIRILAPSCLLLLASHSAAETKGGAVQIPTAPVQSSYLEYLRYEQFVHSASQNTQLGQETLFDSLVGYRFTEDTSFKLRLNIDPNLGSVDNKTSRINIRLLHHYEQFDLQADLAVNGDDNSRGATTFGLDSTSKYSWIAFNASSQIKLVFYPYNMGTEIGSEFRTWDVGRLYYISGTPAYISNLPIESENIRSKTIPGFELQWKPSEELQAYVGVGSASFLYPATPGFTIEENAASDRWKVKEDRGYKAGVKFKNETSMALAEYATHLNGAEGGSILDAAWSLQLQHKVGPIVADFERTWTKAGTNPYRLKGDMSWFQDTTPFRPVYSDYYGSRQDWLGKVDAATMIKAGYTLGQLTPFVAFKDFGQFFIDRNPESAQRLRTADESVSHGGLKVVTLGADYVAGKFNFRPEVNFMQAKNSVFGNRTDVREDRILSELNSKDTVVKLTTTYSY